MSDVLVTGGAGFIGSHLVDGLLARGDVPVVVDDLSTGDRTNVTDGVELVEVDVAEPGALVEVLGHRTFDAVLHVAGQASIATSFEHPERDLRVNVNGTLNVLDLCTAARVPRLVYASSMTVYGEPESVPIPEAAQCRPISYYGITKYAAERYVHATPARPDASLEVTSLRMFNVYGERQTLSNPYQGVLAVFIGNVLRDEPITIHSDGAQTRDFVYVGDVVDAWLRILDARDTAGRVYNVGSGRETTIADLAAAVVEAFGRDGWDVRRAPAQPGDQRRSAADVSAITADTRWRPATPLADGMRRTIEWARS